MSEVIDWQGVDHVPPLAPGEIHLWWQDLGDPAWDRASMAALLNEREHRRVARFKPEGVKREFTAARGLLKVLLSRYVGRPPHELAFRYGPLGKPSLAAAAGGDELRFNYTDSEGFALYAFGWNCELGVDLEMLSRQVRYRRIIERRFAPAEAEALLALPDGERRRMFLACWTRKEGYGKALGLGIRYPFDCLDLCLDCKASPLSVSDHVNGEQWDIHQIHPTDNFVGALVHPAGSYRQRHFSLRAVSWLGAQIHA